MTFSLFEQLSHPFTYDAYSADVSRGQNNVMTSLKAQFIKERLTQVLGVDGWKIDGEWKTYGTAEESVSIYVGTLKLYQEDTLVREQQAVGGSPFYLKKKDGTYMNKNVVDVYKSAQTDCLSKAASFIGVGNSAFKGLITPINNGGYNNYSFCDNTLGKDAPILVDEITKLFGTKKLTPEMKTYFQNTDFKAVTVDTLFKVQAKLEAL